MNVLQNRKRLRGCQKLLAYDGSYNLTLQELEGIYFYRRGREHFCN